MREITGERLGTVLRTLAQDLVTERRRVTQLERENRELKKQLEQLRRPGAQRHVEAVLSQLSGDPYSGTASNERQR